MTLPLSETQRQELTLTVAAVMESVNEFAECIPLLQKEGNTLGEFIIERRYSSDCLTSNLIGDFIPATFPEI